jgi:hypothetical protein
MDNFDLKKYLAEGRLLKEDEDKYYSDPKYPGMKMLSPQVENSGDLEWEDFQKKIPSS